MSDQSQKSATLDPEKEAKLNRELIDSVIQAESGALKNASNAASNMIRRRIRENGFSRRILPPRNISDSELTYLPDSELPAVVEASSHLKIYLAVARQPKLKVEHYV